ncbi:DNA repair family protein [Magnaporthiopsis poae ATCC 64411]|uniref:DNA repair family protein n=1 Tax=Magnaporthiopsis poae (strain ATCC 64411 / 73-15) TaxID=644358 RepID=A0A0C4DS29_MAGP6|nr:DNA repair family protein [Magnaporthiopsis poae ATCC 64411]
MLELQYRSMLRCWYHSTRQKSTTMSKKRTIDSFFPSASKKQRKVEEVGNQKRVEDVQYSEHPTYPLPIPELPRAIGLELGSLPAKPPRIINDRPELDLLYFQPYIPPRASKELFEFLRATLPFYRVEYDIKRGGIQTHIRTPRYTTVFGLDDTSRFDEHGNVVDVKTGVEVPPGAYARYAPRPVPKCLDDLRVACEAATDCSFNFCLVNYYASGADSIAFHSDDERFLDPDPAIASLSLGAQRDFLLKRKPVAPGAEDRDGKAPEAAQLKLPLASGDMILMRGKTQANWLHSIPKRTGRNQMDGGRINITFRRAMVKAGTDNYYNYNVGNGAMYLWDKAGKEMREYK